MSFSCPLQSFYGLLGDLHRHDPLFARRSRIGHDTNGDGGHRLEPGISLGGEPFANSEQLVPEGPQMCATEPGAGHYRSTGSSRASKVRRRINVPHPRHWSHLAHLAAYRDLHGTPPMMARGPFGLRAFREVPWPITGAGEPKNARVGCLLCRPWKMNGASKDFQFSAAELRRRGGKTRRLTKRIDPRDDED